MLSQHWTFQAASELRQTCAHHQLQGAAQIQVIVMQWVFSFDTAANLYLPTLEVSTSATRHHYMKEK